MKNRTLNEYKQPAGFNTSSLAKGAPFSILIEFIPYYSQDRTTWTYNLQKNRACNSSRLNQHGPRLFERLLVIIGGGKAKSDQKLPLAQRKEE